MKKFLIMNVPFDWNRYDADVRKKIFEETKSGSISFIKDIDELTSWEIYHAHWEDYLSSSDYWKKWREKINSFKTAKEVNFYTDRLREIIEFIKDHTRKDIRHVEGAKPWDPINTPKLIEQELKRLENISEEEFRKTDKWSNSVEFREMTNKEIIDMLECVPNVDKKVDNFQNISEGEQGDNQFELKQGGSVRTQKDNKGVGSSGIFVIIGVIIVLTVGSLVILKSD